MVMAVFLVGWGRLRKNGFMVVVARLLTFVDIDIDDDDG
jgi:hypothetical protein